MAAGPVSRFGYILIIAVYHELILKIIEVSKMEASPLFDGIREKWIDQGEKKGMQQGAYNERVEAILDALKENTGSYPNNVRERLQSVRDMDTLKTIFRFAVKIKSIDQFTKVLNELLTRDKN
ncbi:hypothetical protein [Desulfotruncus arcticus]|nr:hypothetical protein [Desulfotruncus arcticus]